MGLPDKAHRVAVAAVDTGSKVPARPGSGAGAAQESRPKCDPRRNEDNTFDYICPFCAAAVSSLVRSGQVNHRRHCGNRFRVKDGCVVTQDGVPVPVLRWHSAKQRDDGANRPSQRVRQPVLGKDRQGHGCDAPTSAYVPSMWNGRVVSMYVGAHPGAAHHTLGTPVPAEELDKRGQERSIGL